MNKEKIGGICFAIFGLFVVLVATQIKMPVNSNEPGPRVFPYISGSGMLICGIGMFLTAKKKEKEKPFLSKEGWKKLIKITVLLFLYYFGLEILGFLIATPFFTAAVILLLADGKKVSKFVTVIVALATTGIIYGVFEKAFAILLPSGLFF